MPSPSLEVVPNGELSFSKNSSTLILRLLSPPAYLKIGAYSAGMPAAAAETGSRENIMTRDRSHAHSRLHFINLYLLSTRFLLSPIWDPGSGGCDGVQGRLLICLIGVHRFPPDMDHIYNCGKTPQKLRGNYSIKSVCLQGSAWSKRQFFSRLQQV